MDFLQGRGRRNGRPVLIHGDVALCRLFSMTSRDVVDACHLLE